MLRIAQTRVAPVPAIEQRPRPAVLMMDVGIEEKRSILSGLASIASTVSPSNCSAQASAAVMDVTPVPLARPVIPE